MYIKQLLKCVHDYQCLIGMPILYAYKPGVTYKCLQWKGALSVKSLRGLSPELGIVRAQLFPRCIQNTSTQAFPAKYSMLFILYVSKEHSLGDIYNPTHLWQNAVAPISAVIHTINPLQLLFRQRLETQRAHNTWLPVIVKGERLSYGTQNTHA